jgi:hypothetical protein
VVSLDNQLNETQKKFFRKHALAVSATGIASQNQLGLQ